MEKGGSHVRCSAVFLVDTIEAFWANVLTDVWTWIKENPSDTIPFIIVAVVLALIVFLTLLCAYGLLRFSSFVARVLGEQFCKETPPPSDNIPINTYYTQQGYTYLIALLFLWFFLSRLCSLFIQISLWRFWTVYAFFVLSTYVLLIIDSARPLFQQIFDLIKKMIVEPVLFTLKGIRRIAHSICPKENACNNSSPEEAEQDRPPCEGGKEQP